MGPEPHTHDDHVDSFYVLEGEAAFVVGGEKLLVGAGSFVAAPPGIVHTFSSGPGREPAAQRARAERGLPRVAAGDRLGIPGARSIVRSWIDPVDLRTHSP